MSDIEEVPFKTNSIHAPPSWKTAADLQIREFEPIRWVVPMAIPEGLTLLAGKPKRGKSWMALNFGIAVASAGVALDSLQCEQGDVLALMLEDNERRLQDRLRQLEPASSWPSQFAYATEWPRLDEDGLIKMEAWVQSVERPRLIIVDVLATVRAKANGKNTPYADDYSALKGLQEFASKHRIAVVVVTHCRKATSDEDVFDEVSGTTGLSGAADSVLVLKRGEGKADFLYGRGRDLPEFEKAVSFDKTRGLWCLLGDADAFRGNEVELKIVSALSENGDPMSVRDIVGAVGGDYQSIKQRLYRMATAGTIRKLERGRYGSV